MKLAFCLSDSLTQEIDACSIFHEQDQRTFCLYPVLKWHWVGVVHCQCQYSASIGTRSFRCGPAYKITAESNVSFWAENLFGNTLASSDDPNQMDTPWTLELCFPRQLYPGAHTNSSNTTTIIREVVWTGVKLRPTERYNHAAGCHTRVAYFKPELTRNRFRRRMHCLSLMHFAFELRRTFLSVLWLLSPKKRSKKECLTSTRWSCLCSTHLWCISCTVKNYLIRTLACGEGFRKTYTPYQRALPTISRLNRHAPSI